VLLFELVLRQHFTRFVTKHSSWSKKVRKRTCSCCQSHA